MNTERAAVLAALVIVVTTSAAITFALRPMAPASAPVAPAKEAANPPDTVEPLSPPPLEGIVYRNDDYGFDLALPDPWAGYAVIADTWEGAAPGGPVIETGPMILIRHPLWTEAVPRQDIPIMVFTAAQWDAMQAEEFHIGAAPIGPSELGRNATHVFGLPARYNYAFPEGFEEVDDIISGGAFTAF